MSSFSDKVRRSLKKGVSRTKESLKRFYQNFEQLRDPKKTKYTFKKTEFVTINVDLKKNDPQYRRWLNWVIERFAMLGYSVKHERILDTENQKKNIDSVSFDFSRNILYDNTTKRFWQRKIQQIFYQRFWQIGEEEKEWKFRRFWQKEKEAEKPPRFYNELPQEEEKTILSKSPKDIRKINVEGFLTIFIHYGRQEIEYQLVVDIKDPMINQIESDLSENLRKNANFIVNQLKVLLYSEMTDDDIKLLEEMALGELEEEIERDMQKGFSRILDAMEDSFDDDIISNEEYNKIMKAIELIRDEEFQSKMKLQLNGIRIETDKRKRRNRWLAIQEIMRSAIKKYARIK